jgi:general stress protein YciG
MEGRGENNMKRTANRGFASMDREQQRAIARKGGLAVSQNRQHMAEIGKKGGESSGESRGKKSALRENQNQEQPQQTENQ